MDKRRRETWLTRLLINYPPRSLRRYNKMISGRLYRDSGCERPSRHKVAACAPAAVVINNAARGSREAAVVGPRLYGPSRRTLPACAATSHTTTGGVVENLAREDRDRGAPVLSTRIYKPSTREYNTSRFYYDDGACQFRSISLIRSFRSFVPVSIKGDQRSRAFLNVHFYLLINCEA